MAFSNKYLDHLTITLSPKVRMSGFVNLYSLLSCDIQTNLLFFFKLAYFFSNVNFGPFNWHLYLNVAKFGHDINTSYGQSHIRVGVLKFRMAMTKHKKIFKTCSVCKLKPFKWTELSGLYYIQWIEECVLESLFFN